MKSKRSSNVAWITRKWRDERWNPFAEVKVQMKGRKIDTPVDFRLIHRTHEWRVHDVAIDGASIMRNYRSLFSSIIREVSYVGVGQEDEAKDDRRNLLQATRQTVPTC